MPNITATQQGSQYMAPLLVGGQVVDSIAGAPNIVEDDSLTSKVVDFYKRYWGGVWSAMVGDREGLMEAINGPSEAESKASVSPASDVGAGSFVLLAMIGVLVYYTFRR